MAPTKCNLETVKKEIRGLLVSSSSSMNTFQLNKDYKNTVDQGGIPFSELGFSTLQKFLESIPDVVRLHYQGGHGYICTPVVTSKTAHINDMVQSQKKTRAGPRRQAIPEPKWKRNVPVETASWRSDKRDSTKEWANKYSVLTPSDELTPRKTDTERKPTSTNTKNVSSSAKLSGLPADYDDDDVDNCNGSVLSVSPPLSNEHEGSALSFISDKMKDNFHKILEEHPDGIKCSELRGFYKDKFGVPLNYESYGFEGMPEFVLSLPDVFSLHRKDTDREYILYDARKGSPQREKPRFCWIPDGVKSKIRQLLCCHPEGVELPYILQLYEKNYNEYVDWLAFGFPSELEFIKNIEKVELFHKNGIWTAYCHEQGESTPSLAPAIPANVSVDSLWRTRFPEYVAGPNQKYLPFDSSLIVDEFIKVTIPDVIHPHNFFIQLLDQRNTLDDMMSELNTFYDNHQASYVMNSKVALPGVMCALKYFGDSRWHRALIISSKSDNNVEVSYVDYGTVGVVPANQLRLLDLSFASTPIQCVRSWLSGITWAVDDKFWSQDASDSLFTSILHKIVVARVISIDKEEPSLEVILFDTTTSKDINLNDWLISTGYASHIGVRPSSRAKSNSPDRECVNAEDRMSIDSFRMTPDLNSRAVTPQPAFVPPSVPNKPNVWMPQPSFNPPLQQPHPGPGLLPPPHPYFSPFPYNHPYNLNPFLQRPYAPMPSPPIQNHYHQPQRYYQAPPNFPSYMPGGTPQHPFHKVGIKPPPGLAPPPLRGCYQPPPVPNNGPSKMNLTGQPLFSSLPADSVLPTPAVNKPDEQVFENSDNTPDTNKDANSTEPESQPSGTLILSNSLSSFDSDTEPREDVKKMIEESVKHFSDKPEQFIPSSIREESSISLPNGDSNSNPSHDAEPTVPAVTNVKRKKKQKEPISLDCNSNNWASLLNLDKSPQPQVPVNDDPNQRILSLLCSKSETNNNELSSSNGFEDKGEIESCNSTTEDSEVVDDNIKLSVLKPPSKNPECKMFYLHDEVLKIVIRQKPFHLMLLEPEIVVPVEDLISGFTDFSSFQELENCLISKKCLLHFAKVTQELAPKLFNQNRYEDFNNEAHLVPFKYSAFILNMTTTTEDCILKLFENIACRIDREARKLWETGIPHSYL